MEGNVHEDLSHLLHLQEISQKEFCEHIEDEDFTRVYGNPVIINTESGKRLLCIAWELEERIMRASGRGDEADEIIRLCREQSEQGNLQGA